MGMKIHDRDLRGRTQMGWLDSYHTFSFGHFRDPNRIRFRSLRVINEDYVAGGSGFPTHPHDNMEIITIVLEGALQHRDSMGNGSVIKAGDIQKMSAGSGITHSEFNASSDETCHLYQIWIMPDTKDIDPNYEQMSLDTRKEGQFNLIGSREGGEGQIKIYQNVNLYHAKALEGSELSHNFEGGRNGFLQILRGAVEIGGETLKEGDALELSGEPALDIKISSDAELLLFDLA
jgi:quercetin 2,3-dioxygenase